MKPSIGAHHLALQWHIMGDTWLYTGFYSEFRQKNIPHHTRKQAGSPVHSRHAGPFFFCPFTMSTENECKRASESLKRMYYLPLLLAFFFSRHAARQLMRTLVKFFFS